MRRVAFAGWSFAFGLATLGCAGVLGIPSDEGLQDAVVEASAPDQQASPDTSAPDTSIPDAAPDVDAAPPPPLCDVTKDFAAPLPLASVNTAEDDGAARLSEDELTIYIDGVRSAQAASYGIFYATRSVLTDSFGPVMKFPSVDDSIDTSDDEYAPNVVANGLVLMFERKTLATSDSNIYTATRTSISMPFGSVSPVDNLNTQDYEANVFVRGTTTELWHVRKPLNNIDIALATFKAGSGYVINIDPTVAASLNTNGYDGSPVISKDGRSIYLSSDRAAPGFLGNNIWSATRATPSGPFSTPVLVANVNSDSNEYPGFISGDGCRLYLVSSRPGVGGQDIYVATRPK